MNTKKCLLWGIAWLLCGCAISPPEPPQPEGEFRPVNEKNRDTLQKTMPSGTQGEVQP